ncbi:MAG: S26 family signal peptidase, partial [Euryarchaeota archaeon]|nr:S26 family signal peptidase [Euryarchaeota archaeon]
MLTVLAIVILLGGLFAYSGNWPPLVVVESSSMQHGGHDVLGIINTGDLVLVKKVVVPSGVTTYVEGLVSGYTTYGEYGDVLLYFANGNTAYTPVIHRAMLWLDWNQTAQEFAAPSLAPLSDTCGLSSWDNYAIIPPGAPAGTFVCVSPSSPNTPFTGTLDLFNIGWQQVNVSIDLTYLEKSSGHSGFITEGDDNCNLSPEPCVHGETGTYDQSGCIISCIVAPG